MASEARAGEVADLTQERPYEGVSRRTIRGSHHTVMVYEFEPGAAFPLHRHDEEQTTLIVSGEVELMAAGEKTRLGAGEWSYLTAGVPHRIVAGPQGARFIAVVAPARKRLEVLGGP